eukprot:365083-Chlamydomonas_euryale.AAC.29
MYSQHDFGGGLPAGTQLPPQQQQQQQQYYQPQSPSQADRTCALPSIRPSRLDVGGGPSNGADGRGGAGGVLWGPHQTGTLPGQYAPAGWQWSRQASMQQGPAQHRQHAQGGEAASPNYVAYASGVGVLSTVSSPSSAAAFGGRSPMPYPASQHNGGGSGSPGGGNNAYAYSGRPYVEPRPAGKVFGREAPPHGLAAGAYSGIGVKGQLHMAETGLAPTTYDWRRQAQPPPARPLKPVPASELPAAAAFMHGADRNVDAVHEAEMGYTGAHTAKDGINAFEGTYGPVCACGCMRGGGACMCAGV